jgi:hypothetical protein
MTGGTLPAGLLCGAVGLALSFATRRARFASVIILAIAAPIAVMATFGTGATQSVLLGCWTSVAASAASVHSWRGLDSRVACAMSLNAGFWSGAMIAVTGSPSDLFEVLPCVLVAFPAAWVVRSGVPIAIKVVSSWLIAIALLSTTLTLAPVTPGYLPDHLE